MERGDDSSFDWDDSRWSLWVDSIWVETGMMREAGQAKGWRGLFLGRKQSRWKVWKSPPCWEIAWNGTGGQWAEREPGDRWAGTVPWRWSNSWDLTLITVENHWKASVRDKVETWRPCFLLFSELIIEGESSNWDRLGCCCPGIYYPGIRRSDCEHNGTWCNSVYTLGGGGQGLLLDWILGNCTEVRHPRWGISFWTGKRSGWIVMQTPVLWNTGADVLKVGRALGAEGNRQIE